MAVQSNQTLAATEGSIAASSAASSAAPSPYPTVTSSAAGSAGSSVGSTASGTSSSQSVTSSNTASGSSGTSSGVSSIGSTTSSTNSSGKTSGGSGLSSGAGSGAGSGASSGNGTSSGAGSGTSSGAGSGTSSGAGSGTSSGKPSTTPSPTPSPQSSSSSSPLPCGGTITGPANVPGMSQYFYEIDEKATDIKWSVNKAFVATILDDNTKPRVQVSFSNAQPAVVTLRADYKMNGSTECATKEVAVVKVAFGVGNFGSDPEFGLEEGLIALMVKPPAANVPPIWITTFKPGSQYQAFTYNGTNAATEAAFRLRSGSFNKPIFSVSTAVSLTPPDERPTAVQKIQIGHIQTGFTQGSCTYLPPAGAQNLSLIRDLVFPATGDDSTLDWTPDPNVPPPPGMQWPWYGNSPGTNYATGSGSGFWLATLGMADAPTLSIAQEYDPNNTLNNAATAHCLLDTFTGSEFFITRVAAATLDSELEANQRFFAYVQARWGVSYLANPTKNQASATLFNGTGPWQAYNQVTEINVNVVPTSRNHNIPFRHDVFRNP